MITVKTNPRTEMVAELRRLMPYLRFLKVRTNENGEPTTYFPQVDTPQFQDNQTFIHPTNKTEMKEQDIYLSITTYPNTLKMMTAMEAGAYALRKCLKENKPITEFHLLAAIAHLEMEI